MICILSFPFSTFNVCYLVGFGIILKVTLNPSVFLVKLYRADTDIEYHSFLIFHKNGGKKMKRQPLVLVGLFSAIAIILMGF